jgi:hypothetical protein
MSSGRTRADNIDSTIRSESRRAAVGRAMTRSFRIRLPVDAASSTVRSATARHGITTPGNVVTSHRAMASTGSPSGPRVDGMNPSRRERPRRARAAARSR